MDIFIGRTHNKLCPIEVMLAYLVKRGGRQGFLFLFKDGCLLTRDRFIRAVREALEKAGIDQKAIASTLERRQPQHDVESMTRP